MITINDVKTKSQAELVQLLVNDLKEGSLDQFYLLDGLIKTSLSGKEKTRVEAIIQDLAQYCEKGIAANNSHAMTISGRLNQYGLGRIVNFDEAIKLYERAITLGNAHAMTYRAIMHQTGQGDKIDFDKAIELYERAITLGHAHAMSNRAFMYKEGEGGPVDFAKAIELYEQAITLGHATARNNLALIYQHGQGCRVDFAKAIELYEQAITLGHDSAMTNRATIHRKGLGGPVNFDEAIKLYELAIKLGDTSAMTNRAGMYKNGLGGPVNFDEAIKLYERAITLGNDSAMSNRALMHQNGQGGRVNFDKAIELYELAITLGNTSAMHNRAFMYQEGQGGRVNFDKAIELYERAITFDHANAMHNRAFMYQNGQGGPIDIVNAARLYRRAAEKNITFSLNALNNPDNTIFSYHYLMSQKRIAAAAELIITNFDLVTEFIEFDCKHRLINNPDNIKFIEEFIDKFSTINLDKQKQNKLYYSVVMALDECEKEIGQTNSQFTSLKIEYLSRLNLADIKQENLSDIVQVVINTWYNVTNDVQGDDASYFTKQVAQILSQAMYGLKFFGKEEDFLTNIALILVKSMYGEHYGIRLAFSWSIEQVMLLVAFYKNPIKLPVEYINFALGAEGLIYKYQVHAKDVGAIATKSSGAASSNRLSFFDKEPEKPIADNTSPASDTAKEEQSHSLLEPTV